MRTGANGLALIKHFEGLRLGAYLDQGGLPTIGYGHTLGVQLGQAITLTEAEDFLSKDLFSHERDVDGLVFAAINQNQFDSLVSFTYNLGAPALERSTLLKDLNKGNYMAASQDFLRWVYVKGTINPGLIKRRTAESKLFLTPTDDTFSI